jgi:hypothetical protein
VLLTKDGFIQGYNAQAAVDGAKQIIVAHGLTQSMSDCPQPVPLVDAVRANLGRKPREISADAGYCSEDNLWALTTRKRCGDLVLDPFGGSGTTLIAAERRSARLIEYDPAYCDTILRRFERVTGKQATRSATSLLQRQPPRRRNRRLQATGAIDRWTQGALRLGAGPPLRCLIPQFAGAFLSSQR